MSVYRTTPEQFNTFREAVLKWCDIFGMTEYELFVKHEVIQDDGSVIADTYVDLEAMIATVRLSKKQVSKLNDTKLDETALHEVLEIILFGLGDMIPKSYPGWIVNQTTHVIIQKIVNAFKRGRIQVRNQLHD